MRNSKSIQYARHFESKTTEQEKEETLKSFYADYDYVLCFDAVHEIEDGVWGIEPYTWYVPAGYEGRLPVSGDLVEVENLNDTAVVQVVTHTYTKTIKEHVEDIHPYCAFISFANQHED